METISYIAIIIGILSAIVILLDVFINPQQMKIMNIVWPINGLYLGPFGIWAYWKIGREKKKQHSGETSNGKSHHHSESKHESKKRGKTLLAKCFCFYKPLLQRLHSW
ncbi:hypothetical protein RCG23_09940 [Neobacillus sp. PS3-34]|uniref:hypothetical protein n=1 Tax=Neobacillus sp. PS3-34 TaxID=3070678 RepID=UPI0027E11AB1|nr:hypothetical protein [Neobacillus sp. PS3-34]WML50740.1 hypothetical protein RCG23_09940 [Neobacillus sp. PS3-34]